MTKQNKKRKIRRVKTDKKNASSNGKRNTNRLNQNEQLIYNITQQNKASGDNNRKLLDGLQASVNQLSQQIQMFDQKMENYDKNDIIPRFERIENKQDVMIDLMIQLLEVYDLTPSDEQLEVLGLTYEDTDNIEEKDNDTVE